MMNRVRNWADFTICEIGFRVQTNAGIMLAPAEFYLLVVGINNGQSVCDLKSNTTLSIYNCSRLFEIFPLSQIFYSYSNLIKYVNSRPIIHFHLSTTSVVGKWSLNENS